MSENLHGAHIRIYMPREVPERSWRSLWRERWVRRDIVIFAGLIESGSVTRSLNQPSRAAVQAVDALGSFTLKEMQR